MWTADCDEAMGAVAGGEIDLAFIDFKLGGLDGIEFCRQIRRSSQSPNPFLPIIMVTAYSERRRVIDAVNAGVDEFLVKPIRAVDVANRMNAVIERRRSFIEVPGYFGPDRRRRSDPPAPYTHLRAHETTAKLVCRLLLEKIN